jgi:hypothetical protein
MDQTPAKPPTIKQRVDQQAAMEVLQGYWQSLAPGMQQRGQQATARQQARQMIGGGIPTTTCS